jgi:hypothetical protein
MLNLEALADQIDDCYDGPHTTETVTGAAAAISALTRYLANATRPDALPYASHVHQVLRSLTDAARSLDQVLDRLGEATARHAQDPSLYDDRPDQAAGITAGAVLTALGVAQSELVQLTRRLDEAGDAASHLAHGGEI